MEKNNEHSQEQMKVLRLVHDPKNGKRVDAETFLRTLSQVHENTLVVVEHRGTGGEPHRLVCDVRFKPKKGGEEAA